METCLTLRSAFNLPLRALQEFVNSLLNLMDAPIHLFVYNCLCKREKTIDVQYRTKPTTHGFIDIVVDSTGLKVYGNGEWHTRKHRASTRRPWRKLHLSIDAASHDIVNAKLSMVNMSDGEALGDLLRPLSRNIDRVTCDGAYDTRDCYDEVAAKLRAPKGKCPILEERSPEKLHHNINASNWFKAMEGKVRLSRAFAG
ncbi:IS5 family transposase [Pseudoalteromonas luteoviolacea]|uniref:IS5 family transposase n=1 Tax=Pseudoalteromonas luteoviolacea TaxID=43657 RepID=UPI003F823E68